MTNTHTETLYRIRPLEWKEDDEGDIYAYAAGWEFRIWVATDGKIVLSTEAASYALHDEFASTDEAKAHAENSYLCAITQFLEPVK